MKILVTGAGGFVGRALALALLERGHEVRGLGRSPQPELEARGVRFFRADLSDPDRVSAAVEGVEAVFHVAAKAGVWGSEGLYRAANVDGTVNLIEAIRRHRVSTLVYTSTPSVVYHGGPIVNGDESLPYGTRFPCHYAATKQEAESMVLEAARSGPLRALALRPHLIWGPGDPHLLPRVMEQARAGKLRQVGPGRNRVDLTYIDNVVDAHLLALDALQAGKGNGQAYFITNGEPVSLWPWIRKFLSRAQLPAPKRTLPLPLAYTVGAALEAVYGGLFLSGEPPLTRFVAVELAKDHTFSIEAARRDLGYRPRVSMAEGLERYLSHIQESVGEVREIPTEATGKR